MGFNFSEMRGAATSANVNDNNVSTAAAGLTARQRSGVLGLIRLMSFFTHCNLRKYQHNVQSIKTSWLHTHHIACVYPAKEKKKKKGNFRFASHADR